MPAQPFSLRLSPAALAALDSRPEGRTAALEGALGAIAAGGFPSETRLRRTAITSRVSPEAVEQARAAIARTGSPASLTEAIEAALLAEDF